MQPRRSAWVIMISYGFVVLTLAATGCTSLFAVPEDPNPWEYADVEVVDQGPPRLSQQEAVNICMAQTALQDLADGSRYEVTQVETYAEGRRINVEGTAVVNSDHEGVEATYRSFWYCTVDDGTIDIYDMIFEARVATDTQEPAALVESDPQTGPCVIKGNVSFTTGERIYHVPGQEYYDETVINPSYGERWFCSEDEAVAAGWRRSYQ